jgi:arylsulfatase A-like enzyme
MNPAAVAAFVSFTWLVPALSASIASRPNFVFFLVDDLGVNDLGCYNPATFYETPHVDGLARDGMRFERAYAASCVCSPTRGSILCGKYPARTKTTDWFSGKRTGRMNHAEYITHLPLEEVTVAEALREAGYGTAFVGKWHLGGEGFEPERQGFDTNIAGMSNGSPPSWFSPYKNAKLPDGPPGEHLPERLARESSQIIKRFAAEKKPFFLHHCLYLVHTPLRTKPELVTKYTAKAERLGRSADTKHFPSTEEEQIWPDTPERRRVRSEQSHPVYAGMMETMDRVIGAVTQALAEAGVAGNTVVFFFSDNGGLSTSEGHPTTNKPLRCGKGWGYEGGIRSPLIVRWPGKIQPGSTAMTPAISTDFYPTMLEMAGLPARPAQHVDGRSLVPVMLGKADRSWRERSLFWHYPHYANQGGFPFSAVQSGGMKLLERLEDGRIHLYNLDADPSELHDLASQMPDKAEAMREQLHRWRQDVGAKLLRPLN